MTTAPEQQVSTTAAANETIRRTVRALRSAHDTDARMLANYLGISRGSFYNRLNGSAPFIGGELVALARFFGVTVQEICDGSVRIAAPVAVDPDLDIPLNRGWYECAGQAAA